MMLSAMLFLPRSMILLMNLEIVLLPYFGSGTIACGLPALVLA